MDLDPHIQQAGETCARLDSSGSDLEAQVTADPEAWRHAAAQIFRLTQACSYPGEPNPGSPLESIIVESAARLFAGADAQEAASAIGVTAGDVKEWQASGWRPEVVRDGFAAECFAAVRAAVHSGNAEVAMACLERIDPRFAPRILHSFANAAEVEH